MLKITTQSHTQYYTDTQSQRLPLHKLPKTFRQSQLHRHKTTHSQQSQKHRHSQSHHIQIYSHSGTIIHVDAQNHIAHRITPSHTHTLKRCYFCFLGQTSRQVGMRSSSFHSPPPPHTHSIPSEETSRFGLLCFRVYFSPASVSQFNSRIP